MTNRMTDDEIIDIIQAKKAGAEIERQSLSNTDGWLRCRPNVAFDFSSYRYRIKPKLDVLWVNKWNSLRPSNAFETVDEAVNSASLNGKHLYSRIAVRYVEQPEDKA